MRFAGKVGFVNAAETSTDVHTEVADEKTYYGSVTKNSRRWENGDSKNDDLNISNTISIVANDYAYEHIGEMRYVWWLGKRWKITNLSVDRPRIILTLGGLYNGG